MQSDWCDIHTSLTDPLTDPSTDPLTDPLTEPPITYPTRRLRGIFLQKNNSKIRKFVARGSGKTPVGKLNERLFWVY